MFPTNILKINGELYIHVMNYINRLLMNFYCIYSYRYINFFHDTVCQFDWSWPYGVMTVKHIYVKSYSRFKHFVTDIAFRTVFCITTAVCDQA